MRRTTHGGDEATPSARYDAFVAGGGGAPDPVATSSNMFADMSMRDMEGRPGALASQSLRPLYLA